MEKKKAKRHLFWLFQMGTRDKGIVTMYVDSNQPDSWHRKKQVIINSLRQRDTNRCLTLLQKVSLPLQKLTDLSDLKGFMRFYVDKLSYHLQPRRDEKK